MQHSFTVLSGKRIHSQEGAAVQELGVRILVVEDYATWSHFICSTLEQTQVLRVVLVVSNGLDAVQRASQLTPDLITLDIGLPGLDGIEAARRILAFAPQAKIVFLSENRDPDIVQEALKTGARGYVLKSRAASELLLAVEEVLRGGTFVSEQLSFSND
jgi:DNA-binding NarL/FixJ family response regulator